MAVILYNGIKYWREKLNRREKSGPNYPDLLPMLKHSPKLNDNRLGFLHTIITLKLLKILIFVISKVSLVPRLPPFSKKWYAAVLNLPAKGFSCNMVTLHPQNTRSTRYTPLGFQGDKTVQTLTLKQNNHSLFQNTQF